MRPASLAPFLAFSLFAVVGCSPSDQVGDDSDLEEVSVGVLPIVDVAPIYLGQSKGFFKDHGIDLNLESGQGGAAIVPGVENGDFDFGFSNLTSLMVAQTQGLDVQAVAPGCASTGKSGKDFGAVVVDEDSKVKSAKDLEDKTVSVNTVDNIGDTTIRQSIRADNGDPDDVDFTEFGFPDMPAQLSKGNVDAAWVVEPFLSIAKEDGARPVAWNFVDIAKDLTIAAYFANGDLAKEDPELVKRFSKAIDESLKYSQDHPDEIRKILNKYAAIDTDVAEKMTLPAFPSKFNRDATEKLGDLGVRDGVMDSKPDLDKLLP